MGSAAAWLAAVGVPLAARFLLGSNIPLWVLLGLTGLKTAAVMVSLRRGGRAGAAADLVALAVSAGLGAALLVGLIITPYSAYQIWFQAFAEHQPRGTVSSLFVLLVALFSSAAGTLFLRGLRLLPAALLWLLGACMAALVTSSPWTLPAIAAGLVLLFAGHARRSLSREHRFRGVALYVLFLTAAAAPAALLSLAGDSRGSRLVDRRLHPGLRAAVVRLLPGFPLLYGIPGFGTSFEHKQLGGTPVLAATPVFRVRTSRGGALYLRTAVFDTYDGRSWSAGSAAAGRTGTGDEGSGQVEAPEVVAALPVEDAIQITILQDYYPLLPHTLDTRRVVLPPRYRSGPDGQGGPDGQAGPLQGDGARGFRLDPPLRYGESVLLSSREGPHEAPPVQPPPRRRTLPAGAPAGGEPASGAGGPQAGTAQAGAAPLAGAPGPHQRYLQLPETPDPRLRRLAASLHAVEAAETLSNIEHYLASNYTYTLRVGRGGGDFGSRFLFETRAGYCVHFATAFVLLARLNGIPARYATGFLSYAQPGTSEVTGLSAHAWPEVRLPGAGWRTWEATSAVNPEYYDQADRGWRYEYALRANRFTTRQLTSLLGHRPLPREERERRRIGPVPLLVAAAAVLLALLPAAWLLFVRPRLLPRGSGRQDALALLRRIVTARGHRSLPAPSTVGWLAWAGQVGAAHPQRGVAARRVASLALEIVYSGRCPRPRQLRYLRAFCRRYCR